MRQALRRNPSRTPAGQIKSLPAPVEGLNFRDPIATLKPTDALILDNYFPTTGSVRLRGGYTAHATGLPGMVETVMEYAGTPKRLFAAAGTGIYDVTNGGLIGAASYSSASNARWQSTMFATLSGQWLVCVNGADGVLTWDGTAWAVQTITGSGVDATKWGGVVTHQARLWFWTPDSPKAFYLGVGAISGAATAFDFGPQLARGGGVAFLGSVSFSDGGEGYNNALVVVSTKGEMLVYLGTDPANANTWRLAGRHRVGSPTGLRAHTAFGADLVFLSELGITSAKGVMEEGIENAQRTTASAKIDPILIRQRAENLASAGWQIFLYPTGQMAMVNAPAPGGSTVQWVVNTLTGAWCRFTGIPARCWCLLDETPYFGSLGAVYRFDSGQSDAGRAIVGEIKGGFSDFKLPNRKRFTMARPLMTTNGDPRVALTINTDFRDAAPFAIASAPQGTALWDQAVWDVSVWSGGTTVNQAWSTVGAEGVRGALRMKTNTIGFSIDVQSVELMMEPGAVPAL